MTKRLLPFFLVIVLILTACNFPTAVGTTTGSDTGGTTGGETGGSTGGGVVTEPPVVPTSTNTLEPPVPTATITQTLVPTATLTPSKTLTSIPCNMATFISDVTIPDNTSIAKSASFVKTWRIQNVGSCTWTSGYSLVFFSGDQMSGPASIQLTSGTVAPGQTVDVSVSLTAPASTGTFRGNWKFREPGGVIFGLTNGNPVWVQIVVSAPAAVTANLPVVEASSGMAWGDGTTYTARNAGDSGGDVGSQALISFDMSGIPAGAIIQTAKVQLSDFDTLGDPFGSLGNLRMIAANYGTVSADDYVPGPPVGALLGWGSAADMGMLTSNNAALASYIQTRVGSTKAQFRFQMDFITDLDGVGDMVRLGTGCKIIITYYVP